MQFLEARGLRHNGQDLVDDVAGQLGGVGTRSQLGEPGVVLEGGDDADKVALLQVLKVGEAELVGVVGEVDGVDVPGDLFPIGQVVIVAVAGILRGKAPTGTLRMKGVNPLERRMMGREWVSGGRINGEKDPRSLVMSSIPCP